jgi:hypothetical protein
MNEEKNENFPASIAVDHSGDEIPPADEADAKARVIRDRQIIILPGTFP